MALVNVLILVPARYHSSRFPGKPMALVGGIPMIQRVYQQMKTTQFDVAVVTDHPIIEELILGIGGNVVRVDDDVVCGTDRIFLAYERYFKEKKDYQLIINVQGDEPLLTAEEIIKLAQFHLSTEFAITTLVKRHQGDEEDLHNPGLVKAVFCEGSEGKKDEGRCLYFSRAALPYYRDRHQVAVGELEWFHHIGVYSYRPEALTQFVGHPVGSLEAKEKLEQLRALEMGLTIGAKITSLTLLGIDTPEDLLKVEGHLHAAT